MTPATRIAATVVALLVPSATWAQDTPPTADAAAPEAAAAEEGAAEPSTPAPQPGGNLATGEAAAAQEPTLYVREEHGDWEVRCLRAPEGTPDPCQMFQRLNDADGNPTADANFFDLPPGAELAGGATITTPLQTLLTAQLTMTVDGGQPRRYPFAFCDVQGCYARLGFTAEDMAQFRRGASATLVVVPALAPDQPAELRMSLSGFTAAMAAIEVEG